MEVMPLWDGSDSQYQILKDFGYAGTVDDLKQEAIDNGWYDSDVGTNLCDVGKLLESHGVACDMYVNSNAFSLAHELAQGKRVIVAVDSGELWADSPFQRLFEHSKDLMGVSGADHAVVVSGLDMSDPDNPMVVVTDSGVGHAAMSYSLEQFTDAWRDGNCTMWVTQDVPSRDFCPALENFDYDLGHVAFIGGSSYDDWLSSASEFIGDVAEFMKVAIPVVVGTKALLDYAINKSSGGLSAQGANAGIEIGGGDSFALPADIQSPEGAVSDMPANSFFGAQSSWSSPVDGVSSDSLEQQGDCVEC